ncbi:DNA-directed RNA polymerase subunit alpha [Dyadobacter sp. CECT 9623]|uniref:DNA-directed RNA polymerase subunit alpha n=1 Tax=Dyadobacter linearis TaxID=2823330 RepID=A0ABN7RAH2_9BACT|nr:MULTISPECIES: DNA-directed RNA polymerase subunit alpha [unclassified Dyadobacter]MCE7061782.1 DNA-directed RNA polymerase subunit alpha [Dyadobacter sp. CY343]CAG5070133.1 DNA-directed RNA polymerase subunit alpha [Dyadobacter sp. CECT 9623]
MSILAFQMPDKVVMEKADDFHGLFEFKPLEKGYGVTIGNALRRILLSSLEGYAITSVKFPGVLHEFSSIEGIVEDVTEIILNLKMVRFKKVSDLSESRIVVSLKNVSAITAGDIGKFTNAFEVLNPDQIICHIDDQKEFEMELLLDKGRGYVPADEPRANELPFGYIAVDSIYTPIKNVKYSVENTRVEQRTDYERLLIDIQTDGSIHPEDALKGAANILIQHFMLFSDQTMTFEKQKAEEDNQVDEEMLRMRKLLKTSLSELDLSVRAYNCLKSADVKSLGDLVRLEISDMMKFRNFGKKSLTELEQLVADKQLTFGMDVAKYRLDED